MTSTEQGFLSAFRNVGESWRELIKVIGLTPEFVFIRGNMESALTFLEKVLEKARTKMGKEVKHDQTKRR